MHKLLFGRRLCLFVFRCHVVFNVVLCCSYVVDAILIPTPFYGVITEDLNLYSDVKLFHVPLDCEVGKQNLIRLL